MLKQASKESSENVSTDIDPGPKPWYSWLLLIAIVIFAIYLRYEDFSVWKKDKANFQYEGEYQMANFDSYYYLQIAKELQQGTYDSHQEKRRVPNGAQNPVIPPLLPLLAVTLSSVSNVPVATVAIFLPVVLASLLAPLVFMFSLKLHFNRIAALVAALFSILSLTYIIRSRIGVFDTDSLNVVFVLLNSYLIYQFAEIKDKRRYLFLGLAALSAFLFYIWWDTASSVVVISALFPLTVALLFFYKTKRTLLKYGVILLLLSVSAYFIGDQIVLLFKLLFDNIDARFPRNMSISELDSVSIADFIQKTSSNTFLFICMLIGLVALCRKLKLKSLFFVVPILMAIAAFLVGNRFVSFAAPILGLGIGYGVQMLFNQKKSIKPKIATIIAIGIAIIGIGSSYKTITAGHQKTAASQNISLLNALKQYTPKGCNIWTDWDLGYQIHYYLNRGTYADGGFTDGEISYYASFPFAVDNLTVSANFMRFYNENGIEGMNVLYNSLSGVENTFIFLREVLSLKPKEAETWLMETHKEGLLPETDTLKTPRQWTSFLFPKATEDIYLFIHYRMTQTAAWFKQGNSDLKTGETKGLPLFLTFNALREQGNEIKNNQVSLNRNTGVMDYFNQKRYFRSLATFTGDTIERQSYGLSRRLSNSGKDNRFVFQWDKRTGFGAAMSAEMANTTLVKLYLLQEKSPHFEAVVLNSPEYQIWKVKGNAYEIE
ncbi:STT3 domain-containing protein [Poritiphilus flavus]|uniref:Oligosaccharyl transferase STT3 subunit n=1 Tax=Poritiphilus flavus TaxID=2697053 RepID=A0A6L9E8M2_9FLAO|nr:STT3 domain-containing protein [Poritiphilus flavus]NAS11127.1 hypothetical protein [Poritiphilus flavus]